MSVLLMVLEVLAFVVVCVLLFAATRPSQFSVTRTARINADANKIFESIEDFKTWANWSPWDQLDLSMQRTYEGEPRGVGAVYSWKGNAKVGEGRMQITDTAVPSVIKIKLDFIKPFEAHNSTEFTLTPAGDGVDVTWCMSGESNYMSKVMGLFMSMDKMIGASFEQGLANLKKLTEARSPTALAA
jgi:hypothetical protein